MDGFDDRSAFEWIGTLPEPLDPCMRSDWDGFTEVPCFSTVGEIRKKYNHRGLGLYCGRGHMRPEQYISHALFMPGEQYASAGVPDHYLSAAATKRRENEFRFSDSVRLKAHHEKRCLWCRVEPAPADFSLRFDWLRINDKTLFQQVALALGEHVIARSDIATIWLYALPSDLRAIVQARFDDSALQADHVLPVELLREAKERMSLDIFKYAAKQLAAPSCGSCNRGRKALLLTNESMLEARVIQYFFKTRKTAEESPKFAMFREALIQCISAAARLDRRKASGAN